MSRANSVAPVLAGVVLAQPVCGYAARMRSNRRAKAIGVRGGAAKGVAATPQTESEEVPF